MEQIQIYPAAGQPCLSNSETAATAVTPELRSGILDWNPQSQTRTLRLDRSHLERQKIVAHDLDNATSRTFNMLRTQILHKMDLHGWRTLAITSPSTGAGKTVTAINLAIAIAQLPQRTAMLVDFDLRRPSIGQMLGIETTKSLNDILEGNATLPDALISPDVARLVVLPANRCVQRSSEALSSLVVSTLIDDVRFRYCNRIVVFDLPPVLGCDDVITVLPQLDCVLMVVGDGLSTRQEIEDCLRHIPDTKLLGVVLNMAECQSPSYC